MAYAWGIGYQAVNLFSSVNNSEIGIRRIITKNRSEGVYSSKDLVTRFTTWPFEPMHTSAIPPAVPGLRSKPLEAFHAEHYLRHNQRRQEHLAMLGLDLAGKRVLEVGAGIGDHSAFFLDRGCRLTTSDARPENVAILQERFATRPEVSVMTIDLDAQPLVALADRNYSVVYCYGLLYHLCRPGDALRWMSDHCTGMLLLELCVSFGSGEAVNLVAEPQENPTQARSGAGGRPTRSWVVSQLRQHLAHVYLPTSQPWHEEFPVDWSEAAAATWPPGRLSRAVFVASRSPLNSSMLTTSLPMSQTR